MWRLNGGLLLASQGISLLFLFFAFQALFLLLPSSFFVAFSKGNAPFLHNNRCSSYVRLGGRSFMGYFCLGAGRPHLLTDMSISPGHSLR